MTVTEPASPPAAPAPTAAGRALQSPFADLITRRPVAAMAALLTVIVAAFSGLWLRGSLALDGPGTTLYVKLATDYLSSIGRVPYWMPEMWGGAPAWALAPSLPVLLLVPAASIFGADVSVKLAILAFQVLGGLGTYVLARSIWGRTAASVVAAVVYALHPFLISHGALIGSETAMAVLAAVPWLAWSMRLGLRGDGTRHLVVAGLIAAFAVLHQAEYAYALVLLCGLLILAEIGRLRGIDTTQSAWDVIKRAGVVLGIALGGIAFWLLPFLTMGRSFVLSPPELVRGELAWGLGGSFGREIGIFFSRSSGLSGVVSFDRVEILPELFYLGWVCVALSVVTIVLLSRLKGEATLAAIMLVSLGGMWMNTGAVPLAASGPALRHQWFALAITGAVAGLALGAYVRRLHLGRATPVVMGGALILLLAMPFVAPFVKLQSVVPLMATLRFPRFYVVAPLGLALGAAFPVRYVSRWGALNRPDWRFLRPAVLAGAVLVAFFADILPYRTFYQVQAPKSEAAYQRMADSLDAAGDESRLTTGRLDPRSVAGLLDSGRELSVGWPHPVSGKELWRLTGETYVAPFGLREAAWGLTGTGYLAVERPTDKGTADERIDEIALERNPRTLPLVRTYDQAVIVGDANLSPLLATALATRSVGVVTGDKNTAQRFQGMPLATVLGQPVCDPRNVSGLGQVAGEVAVACAVDPWYGAFFAGATFEPIGEEPIGAVYRSLANGLRGMAVWVGDNAKGTELTLYEAGNDGRTLGAEVARGQAVGADEYGLVAYTFDPIVDSAGKTYLFRLTCNGCDPENGPTLVTGPSREGGTGNFVLGDRLFTDRVAAFTPIHDRLPPADTPKTLTQATRLGPGDWRIETDGPQTALLVVAETWFPGWKATVDGRRVPVFEADGAFVGVPLTAGKHVVTLQYERPSSALLGRFITFGMLMGLAWFALRQRRRPFGHRARRSIAPKQATGSGSTRGRSRHTFQMRTPPAEPGGKGALDPEKGGPGPSVAEGKSPRGERHQAVLPVVDDVEPGVIEQPEKRRRPKS